MSVVQWAGTSLLCQFLLHESHSCRVCSVQQRVQAEAWSSMQSSKTSLWCTRAITEHPGAEECATPCWVCKAGSEK